MRSYPKVFEICLPKLNHISEFIIFLHILQSRPLLCYCNNPWLEALMETILCRCLYHVLQFSLDLFDAQKTFPLEHQLIFGNKKNSRGQVWWIRRVVDDSFLLKSKATTQKLVCGQVHCHGGGHRNCCTTSLDVCAIRFPSAALEHCSRRFYSQSVLVEEIP
jgi:hypothetical protein